jgi:hypothetical protein
MAEDKKNFLTSLPGILTGIAAIITAFTTCSNVRTGDGGNIKPDPNVPPLTQSIAMSKEDNKPDAQSLDPGTSIPSTRQEVSPPVSIFNLTAVIDDPDGFTRVRSMKSSTSQVVATINENERFYTYQQNDNWW